MGLAQKASVIMFFVAVSGILASTLGGFVAEKRGYAAVFLFCIVCEVLALLLVVSLLRETLSRGRGPFRLGELGRSWTRLIDRYGCKRFIIISKLIDIVVIAGWLAFTRFEAFVLLHFLYGLIPPTWGPATLTLLMGSVPEEGRAEAKGRLSALTMLVRSPAPYIGGLLYDRVGFRGPILANLVGAIAALMLIFLLVREPAGGA